jgi:hypothetical protein
MTWKKILPHHGILCDVAKSSLTILGKFAMSQPWFILK